MGRHAWYEVEHRGTRFRVRKPLGVVDLSGIEELEQGKNAKEKVLKTIKHINIWSRIKNWFRNILWRLNK